MTTAYRPARARRAVEALEARLDGNPHQPHRPSWTCRGCRGDSPWPCSPARTRLAEAYGEGRSGLAAYLSALLTAAVEEMPATPADELHERFVAWTR